MLSKCCLMDQVDFLSTQNIIYFVGQIWHPIFHTHIDNDWKALRAGFYVVKAVVVVNTEP
jgi:hypothetical protein